MFFEAVDKVAEEAKASLSTLNQNINHDPHPLASKLNIEQLSSPETDGVYIILAVLRVVNLPGIGINLRNFNASQAFRSLS